MFSGLSGLLYDWTTEAYRAVREQFWLFLIWCWDNLLILINYVASFLPPSFTAEMKSLFNSSAMSSLQSVFDVAAWAFPVYSMIAMATVMFTVIGLIRLGRWIFAMVPTLGG